MKKLAILISALTVATILSVFPSMSIQGKDPFKPPKSWPTVSKSEADFKKYFEENIGHLNPIEGIWTVSQTGTWRNVISGITGTIPSNNSYRLAIVKDTISPNFEFTAVVLESATPYWSPGRVKAHFRKTAYEKVFDGLWYNANYSENRGNFVFDENGLLKNHTTIYDPKQKEIELAFEFSLVVLHLRSAQV